MAKGEAVTQSEINRRIALLCGWTDPRVRSASIFMHPPGESGEVLNFPPNYYESLNDCREILKHVETECGVKIAFMNTLETLLQSRCDGPRDVTPWDYLLVEPELICKAFLIVKGKYEE